MRNKFVKALRASLAIFLISLTVVSCSKEKKTETVNAEKIREEKGVPVTVVEVKRKPFAKELTFYATLKGKKEAIKGSSIGGTIEKIRAKVGDYVKKGQIVIEYPKDSPSAQYEQAKAAYENAKKLYERMKALLEAGESSRQNFDNAETRYKVAKRNFETVKQLIFVESPISGYISKIYVNEGDQIGVKKPLFTVSQIDYMKAKIWASENEIKKLKIGQKVVIKYGGKEYPGKIDEISFAMDLAKRAFSVEAIVPNPNRELLSGTTAEAAVKIYENPEAIALSRDAILYDDGRPFVYVVENGKARKRFVDLGVENGVFVEILNGLTEGDKVIDCCYNLLSDGAKTRIVR